MTPSTQMHSEFDPSLFEKQRTFFFKGETLDTKFRKRQLHKLRSAIKAHETLILQALHSDLGKSSFEAFATEIGIVYDEIDFHLSKLEQWSSRKKVPTRQDIHFWSKAWTQAQPYGVCLIISPWNYPFQLSILPLIGAISAGNTAVIKPSELSIHTSLLLQKIINQNFDNQYIEVVLGDVKTAEFLLNWKWDKIFFTGSTRVGKLIMKKAAENLIPISLELGGKSPVWVSRYAKIDLAAKRIVWGKLLNAGQTCIAPDYVLVDELVKEEFIERLKYWIAQFYGDQPENSTDYPKIISQQHFERLKMLLTGSKVVSGGNGLKENRYFEPTILVPQNLEANCMQEEIFGPILPIIAYSNWNDALETIRKYDKPLAFYFFSENQSEQKEAAASIASGSMAINEVIMQVAHPKLPFGGIGSSGFGSYHGHYSFLAFSHLKPILKKTTLLDLPLRYPPYKEKLKWLKWLWK